MPSTGVDTLESIQQEEEEEGEMETGSDDEDELRVGNHGDGEVASPNQTSAGDDAGTLKRDAEQSRR